MIARSLMTSTGAVISACRAVMEATLSAPCPVCERPHDFWRAGVCLSCWDEVIESRNAPVPGGRLIATLTTIGPYEGRLAGIVRCFKFRGLAGLAVPLGERIARRLLATPLPCDLVIPVPLHWRRAWSRGYNQADLLARRIARTLGCRLDRHAMVRRRSTPPQTGRPRRARVANVRGAFGIRVGVRGRSILLVDDVVTTGVTVRECARELMRAGAAEVHVAAVSRTPSRRF